MLKWKFNNDGVDILCGGDKGRAIAKLYPTSFNTYNLDVYVGPDCYPTSRTSLADLKPVTIKLENVRPTDSRKYATARLAELFKKYQEFYKELEKAVNIQVGCLYTRSICKQIRDEHITDCSIMIIYVNGYDVGFITYNDDEDLIYMDVNWPFGPIGEFTTYEVKDMSQALTYLGTYAFRDFADGFKDYVKECYDYYANGKD